MESSGRSSLIESLMTGDKFAPTLFFRKNIDKQTEADNSYFSADFRLNIVRLQHMTFLLSNVIDLALREFWSQPEPVGI